MLQTINFWLDVMGLCFGVIGTIMIYFFGVPRQVDNGGVNFLSLSGDERYDADEIARIARFKRRGNAGLILVGLAFVFQLAGRLIAG